MRQSRTGGEKIAKLIAVFNVVAGGASIVGLYLSIRQVSLDATLIILFILTLLLALFVLLFPGNVLERNVEEKIKIFRGQTPKGEMMVQSGNFNIEKGGPATVQFYVPFATRPEVEVLNSGRRQGHRPSVSKVTDVHVEFTRLSWGGDTPDTFKWIARGEPATELTDP